MTGITKVSGDVLFQLEPGVVAADSYLQVLPSFPPGKELPGYRRTITSRPMKRNDPPGLPGWIF